MTAYYVTGREGPDLRGTKGRVMYIHGKPGICGKGSGGMHGRVTGASIGGGGGGVDAGIAVTTQRGYKKK